MTWGSPRASLYVKCVGTVRAASHPPVWIHRKCELRSLKKTLNGLCLDDDYTIAQRLEHRWLQARVPGSSHGGDSQFFLQTFPVRLFSSKPVRILNYYSNFQVRPGPSSGIPEDGPCLKNIYFSFSDWCSPETVWRVSWRCMDIVDGYSGVFAFWEKTINKSTTNKQTNR